MKRAISLGAAALALALFCSGRLSAKSDTSLAETLRWIDKHSGDFQAEWHTVDAPTRWQPEDFKNFEGSRDVYWQRTVRWSAKSDCPRFSKALEADGETYVIARAISFVGDVTDKAEQETSKDASYTRKVSASYAWRLKMSQVSPDPVVMDYKEYLKRTNETDDQSVDTGTYYYVCILPKEGAGKDAIILVVNDQRTDDGQGHVTMNPGHREPVSIAGIAAVPDRKMADRLATAVGHLMSLLHAQNQPKEPF